MVHPRPPSLRPPPPAAPPKAPPGGPARPPPADAMGSPSPLPRRPTGRRLFVAGSQLNHPAPVMPPPAAATPKPTAYAAATPKAAKTRVVLKPRGAASDKKAKKGGGADVFDDIFTF